MDGTWEVYALKYGEVTTRRRADSFIGGDAHDGPMPLDFFTWVLRSGDRAILVDTGFEEDEAARRGRAIQPRTRRWRPWASRPRASRR